MTSKYDSKFKVSFVLLISWSIFIIYKSVEYYSSSSKRLNPVGYIPLEQHVLAYFVFALLLYLTISRYFSKSLFKTVLIVTFSFGFLMEILQGIIPWRDFSLLDSLFNFMGGVLFITAKQITSFRNKLNIQN